MDWLLFQNFSFLNYIFYKKLHVRRNINMTRNIEKYILNVDPII